MIGKEVGDKLVGEQILCERRKIKGLVLIHRGVHRAQRYVLYGFPAKAMIPKKWRIIECSLLQVRFLLNSVGYAKMLGCVIFI